MNPRLDTEKFTFNLKLKTADTWIVTLSSLYMKAWDVLPERILSSVKMFSLVQAVMVYLQLFQKLWISKLMYSNI